MVWDYKIVMNIIEKKKKGNNMNKEKKVKEFMKQLTKALEYTSKIEKLMKEKAMKKERK